MFYKQMGTAHFQPQLKKCTKMIYNVTMFLNIASHFPNQLKKYIKVVYNITIQTPKQQHHIMLLWSINRQHHNYASNLQTQHMIEQNPSKVLAKSQQSPSKVQAKSKQNGQNYLSRTARTVLGVHSDYVGEGKVLGKPIPVPWVCQGLTGLRFTFKKKID